MAAGLIDPTRVHLLVLLGLFAVAVSLGSLATRGLDPRRWPPPAVAAIVLGVYGHLAGASWALLAAFACALVGVVAPTAWAVRARRRAARGDFAGAARVIGPLARLRPLWADRRDLWRAAAAFYEGDPALAEALARRLAADDGPRARMLRASLVALTRNWEAARYAPVVDLQSRALCELGEVDAGVEAAARVWRPRMGWTAIRNARAVMLAPMAFAGEVEATRRLGRLMRLPAPARSIWRATAEAAAGEPAAAAARLDALLAGELTPALRHAADARRAALPAPPVLGDAARAVVADVRREVAAGALLRVGKFWRSPLAVLLLALIGVGFALQIVRGGGDPEGIALELGALYANGRLPEDGWRLLAYGFLHGGVLHLAANALAIVVLAPMTARAMGELRALGVFVGGVLIGGLGISFFGGHGTTVGASGGAMALLGGALAAMVLHPMMRGTRTGRAALRLGVMLVVVQTVFDAITPRISSAGHVWGGLAGVLIAGLLLWLDQKMKPTPTRSS